MDNVKPPVIVTKSWDDGHPLDLRLVEENTLAVINGREMHG